MRTRYALLIAMVVAGLALVAIYWAGLQGGFFFDDGPSILQAEGVRLDRLSFDALHQALVSGSSGPSGRPVAQLSFALNHYFSGFDPFAFKVTNLAIHGLSGILVFGLAWRLLASALPAAQTRNALMAAGFVAMLWLLHPVQLLPVLHVVQRMTSLSALFLLGALWMHIEARQRGGRAGVALMLLAWGVAWPLSVLSKETGLLFPVFALAWETILRARSSLAGLDRFGWCLVLLVGLAALAVAGYLLSPFSSDLWSGYEVRSFSLIERVLTEGRVLWFYLGLMALPQMEAFGLHHDDIVLSTGLMSPWTTLPALLGLAALVILAWGARRRAPVLAFGVAWFLIGHALESTVLPLELAHEHRNYVPLFGVALMAGWALMQALQRAEAFRTCGVALAATALVYCSFLTALRAHQYGDDVRRTQIEAQYHRQSARAQHEAGVFLASLPEAASAALPTYSFARRHYEIAGELDRNLKMNWLGLLHLNCRAGIPVRPSDLDELARRLRRTPFAPGDMTVLYNLKELSIDGSLCLVRSDMDRLFAAALANPGVSPGVRVALHSWHADYLWLREQDIAAAREALKKSLDLHPSHPSNRLKWIQLLIISGEYPQAKKLLTGLQVRDLSPGERQTFTELQLALKAAAH